MDKYSELMAALDVGPTPGPWFVHGSQGYAVATVGKIRIATDEPHINIRPGDDAEYIAACHPEAIRALLAERDSLRKSLQECARIIQLDRDSLSDTHRDPATGKVEDRLGREGLAEYDGALALARAALAQEQGDSDGTS